jgi:DNA-binding winged helix-turn-helix (wHTH) protein
MKYFPPFRFDDRAGVLTHAGRTVPLTRKAADLLRCLLEHPGTLTSHQGIMRHVWPDTHVQPENVKTLVHELRSALGDHSHDPAFIRSEPGRGYTFIAQVTDAMLPLLWREPGAELAPFAGRVNELALLEERLTTACETSTAQLVLIEGERGSGKTSLCRMLAARAYERAAIRMSYGQCLEVSGPAEPHAVVLEAIDLLARQYPGIVPDAFAQRAPAWLAQFPQWQRGAGAPVEIGAAIDASVERLTRELPGVLDHLAGDVPLLLLLEDLQWGDLATIEWLRATARRHAPSRLVIVATYARTGGGRIVDALDRLARELSASPACHVVTLEPLSEGYVYQYLQDRFGPVVARTVIKPLYRATAGHSGLTVTTMETLVGLGALRRSAMGWRLDGSRDAVEAMLSASLADGLQCQMDQLEPEDRLTLEAAAAVGAEFSVETTALALGASSINLPALQRRLDALARRRVLIEALPAPIDVTGPSFARFRFRHPISADLLLAWAPLARRFDFAGRLERTEQPLSRLA